jgi:DNA polymerase I
VFTEIEMPLVPVLSRMERTGVLVDAAMLARQSRELATRLHELEQEAHRAAGQPFNLGSPKQIQEILYDKLGLPVLAKTPKGAPSTAENVLQELALDYPLPKLILDHRALSKAQIDLYRPAARTDRSGHRPRAYLLSPGGGGDRAVVVHRSESAEHPGAHRGGPAHPPGVHRAAGLQRIVAADYSQIELRIMAHLSEDDGTAEGLRRRPGHASRDRRRGVRRSARPGQRRSAAFRQGDQLRPDLRHVGLRSGEAAGHRARRGAGLRGSVFRALSRA